jgi:hypothetical protein
MGSLIWIAHGGGWESTGWRAIARNNASQGARPPAPNVSQPTNISRSITSIPAFLNSVTAQTEMNARFFLAHRWGGDTVIGYEGTDGVCGVSKDHLKLMLANRFVTAQKKSIPLAAWWLANSQRREVDRVIYDPEGTMAQPDERILNLWTGFAVQPRLGDWSKMAAHIQNIACQGKSDRFLYMMYWLAHAVQHPGTAPGTVLVLTSAAEGAGKTIIAEWIVRMLGQHGILLSTPEQLVGTFNDHLENRSFICLNEPAFPGDHAGARKFKSMITESTWLLNGKFRKPYFVPNIAHIMLTSNLSWVVPAGNKARRFAVFAADESRAGDHAYFAALRAEADNGGIAAMLDFLLRVNLSKCNLRAVPTTPALIEQQMLSASSETQWALDAVEHGDLDPSTYRPTSSVTAVAAVVLTVGSAGGSAGGFGKTHPASELYAYYSAHAKQLGQRPISGIMFGKWLRKCGFKRSLKGGAAGNTAQWYIPDASNFLQAVKQQAGIL